MNKMQFFGVVLLLCASSASWGSYEQKEKDLRRKMCKMLKSYHEYGSEYEKCSDDFIEDLKNKLSYGNKVLQVLKDLVGECDYGLAKEYFSKGFKIRLKDSKERFGKEKDKLEMGLPFLEGVIFLLKESEDSDETSQNEKNQSK